MSKEIVYIIPLHKKDKQVFRAIESIPSGARVVVSMTKGLKNWFNKKKTQVELVESVGSSYPVLVNAGIKYAMNLNPDFKLINILEYDDTVMPNAHSIIEAYTTDWDDVEIFTPLSCVVTESKDPNEDKPVLVGIANEAAMAPQMAEEFGYFDFNMMLRTNYIFLNGCYIKPSVFEDYGMFKENFEMFYDYEFLLRVVYNGGIIRTIPKATHFHGINPDGAFETQKAIPADIRENWLGAARREYFFEDDRKISFE